MTLLNCIEDLLLIGIGSGLSPVAARRAASGGVANCVISSLALLLSDRLSRTDLIDEADLRRRRRRGRRIDRLRAREERLDVLGDVLAAENDDALVDDDRQVVRAGAPARSRAARAEQRSDDFALFVVEMLLEIAAGCVACRRRVFAPFIWSLNCPSSCALNPASCTVRADEQRACWRAPPDRRSRRR